MLGFNLVLLFLRFLFLYYYCSDFGFRFFFKPVLLPLVGF